MEAGEGMKRADVLNMLISFAMIGWVAWAVVTR